MFQQLQKSFQQIYVIKQIDRYKPIWNIWENFFILLQNKTLYLKLTDNNL